MSKKSESSCLSLREVGERRWDAVVSKRRGDKVHRDETLINYSGSAHE